MPINLENILTISARDYCKMHNKELSDYKPKGIHYAVEGEFSLGLFAKEVPDEAEAVTDLKQFLVNTFNIKAEGELRFYGGTWYLVSGTALIPKDKKQD